MIVYIRRSEAPRAKGKPLSKNSLARSKEKPSLREGGRLALKLARPLPSEERVSCRPGAAAECLLHQRKS